MTFKSNTVYALQDPERYDDEEGQGYDRVETYGACDGMFITDCWIVNADGEIHPGYAECPVPVRYDDVKPDGLREGKNASQTRNSAMWA